MNYRFDWSILFTEPYLGLLKSGVYYTVIIILLSSIGSLLFGLLVAVMRMSANKYISMLANSYVDVTRNIPGLFWIMFFYFVFPELLPTAMCASLNGYQNYAIVAGILGLTIDNTGYVSDIIRSGVMSIPQGEKDAAAASGLDSLQQWRYVLIPHGMRVCLPPLGGRMVHNLRNSSLCMAIAAPELTWATQQIESLSFRGIEVTIFATIVYLLMAFTFIIFASWLEKRWDISKNSAFNKHYIPG